MPRFSEAMYLFSKGLEGLHKHKHVVLSHVCRCRYAEAILAYVAFEVGEKRYKEARSIFKKFHRRSMHENGGVTVCEAWLRFEREHGSADDHFQAVIKTEPILFQAVAAATAAANPQAAAESKVTFPHTLKTLTNTSCHLAMAWSTPDLCLQN